MNKKIEKLVYLFAFNHAIYIVDVEHFIINNEICIHYYPGNNGVWKIKKELYY